MDGRLKNDARGRSSDGILLGPVGFGGVLMTTYLRAGTALPSEIVFENLSVLKTQICTESYRFELIAS
jgi:hypothetical protein